MKKAWIGLVAFFLVAHFSPAQTPDSLKTGTRIRLTGRTGDSVIGNYQSCSADAIKLYATGWGCITEIPWSEVTSLQISTSRHRNTGSGAYLGCLSTSLFSLLLALSTDAGDYGGRGPLFLVFGIGLGLPGLLLGGLFGSSVQTDVWVDIPLPIGCQDQSGTPVSHP